MADIARAAPAVANLPVNVMNHESFAGGVQQYYLNVGNMYFEVKGQGLGNPVNWNDFGTAVGVDGKGTTHVNPGDISHLPAALLNNINLACAASVPH